MKIEVYQFTSVTLAVCLGVAITFLYSVTQELATVAARVASAEAGARTAYSQLHDLQEARDDTAFYAETVMSVKLWEAEKQRDECKAQMLGAKK